MDEKELRIGNLILGIYKKEGRKKETKTVCKVLGYDPFNNFLWVESTGENEDFLRFEPIPIFYDLLLEFGFERFGNSNQIRKGGIYFCKLESGGLSCFFHTQRIVNVNYIHQLQNLFYAVNGEELTNNIKSWET